MQAREQLVMDTFVELAGTLASDYDIAEFLHLLVERCQEIQVTTGGVLAVFAFPPQLRGDGIGALNLYRDQPGGFEPGDVRIAPAFADVAAIGILQERKVSEAEKRAQQLQHALDSRVVIEQAEGILRERHGMRVDEAFDARRRAARTNNRKLHDVCAEVVVGGPLPSRG